MVRRGGSSPDGGGSGYSTGMRTFLSDLKREANGSLFDLGRVGKEEAISESDDRGRLRRALRTDVKRDKAVGRLP